MFGKVCSLALSATLSMCGCASVPHWYIMNPEVREDAIRWDELWCESYSLADMPAHAEVLGREPWPVECDAIQDRRIQRMVNSPLRGMERVTIHEASTGRTRSVIVPKGTVVVP